MPEFRLLGPVDVRGADARQSIQGAIQKGLLVSLLVSDNQTVTTSALRTELWGVRRDGSENALHAHVSRLRRWLGKVDSGVRLRASRSCYRLEVADEQVDSRRFVAAVGMLRRSVCEVPSAQLADRLRTELSAWRGPTFGGAVGGTICEGAARSYERTRCEALWLLFDAELRSGHHSRILAELRAQVATHSVYLQQFTEQLMIALYRSGRQVEALQAYQRTVSCLVEYGERPGERLRRTHQNVLTQSPELDFDPDRTFTCPARK